MKYKYKIEDHDSTRQTLKIRVSCEDISDYSGIVELPYPTSLGVPVFSEARIMEQVKMAFRPSMETWAKEQKNKDNISSIIEEADALVGKTVSFDHSIEDFQWMDQTERLRPLSQWYKDNGEQE